MFDTVPGNELEDMFANTEGTSVMPPQMPTVSSAPPLAPPHPSSIAAPIATASFGGGKTLLVGIVVLLVIGAAGTLSYFILSSRVSPVPVEKPVALLPAPTTPPAPAPSLVPSPTPLAAVEPDTDGDGLSDVQEAEIGTDAKNPDTDADGLTDGEEVKIYHTNPLKKDTDGDGYPDGMEVKNGFNPNGPGRLFQVPTQK